MSDFVFNNLMDLASLDTSDLKAQVSRLQAPGIYIVELRECGFTEQAPSDPADPMNYNLVIKSPILVYVPQEGSDSAAKAEDMEGRDLTERYFLYGKDVKEGIQLLMGRYKQAGLKHKGVMGGVPGAPAGWLDEAIGKRIAVRVRHYTTKEGQDRTAFDWLSPQQFEKAGGSWEVLARDFVDGDGNVVESGIAA